MSMGKFKTGNSVKHILKGDSTQLAKHLALMKKF